MHLLTYLLLATFSFYRSAGQKAVVTLALADSLIAQEPGQSTIPKDHRLDVQLVERQTLGVFSHTIRKLLSRKLIDVAVWRQHPTCSS